MDILDYRNKWDARFPDNDNFEIEARDLREFKEDTAGFFGKGSAELLTGIYTVQPADVTNPASDLVIPVPGASAFGTVGIAVPGVSGQDIIVPNSDYTVGAGQLTILASLSPALAAGNEVHYAYLTGTVQAGGVTPADLATKVDKVPGKGLSTNDYTDSERNKVAALQASGSRSSCSNSNGLRTNGPFFFSVPSRSVAGLYN